MTHTISGLCLIGARFYFPSVDFDGMRQSRIHTRKCQQINTIKIIAYNVAKFVNLETWFCARNKLIFIQKLLCCIKTEHLHSWRFIAACIKKSYILRSITIQLHSIVELPIEMEELHTFGSSSYNRYDFGSHKFSVNLLTVIVQVLKAIVLSTLTFLKVIVCAFIPFDVKTIRNQVVLITGGGNGLGRSIAFQLAKHNCRMAIVDVDIVAAKRVCEELSQIGVKALAYQVDVSNYDAVQELKKEIDMDFGCVDILVNNAGLLPRVSLREGESRDLDRIIDVNLKAQFWVRSNRLIHCHSIQYWKSDSQTVRTFLPGMIENGRGHIVAIGSTLGVMASGRAVCYSATKFGISGMMDALYREIKSDGFKVDVTTVLPALVLTRKEFIDRFASSSGWVLCYKQPSCLRIQAFGFQPQRNNQTNVIDSRSVGRSGCWWNITVQTICRLKLVSLTFSEHLQVSSIWCENQLILSIIFTFSIFPSEVVDIVYRLLFPSIDRKFNNCDEPFVPITKPKFASMWHACQTPVK